MISVRLALAASLAALLLAACGGSQPTTAAGTTPVERATRSRQQSFHGYYHAKFTDVVGSILPLPSVVCLRFTLSSPRSGSGSGYKWSSVPSDSFDNGTYAVSGNELFASAQAPWSPVIYATLQGSVTATQGSGDYIVMQPGGALYSGGTFTLTRVEKKHC